MVANLRVGIFNAVFIDYLTISIRTLGHYPTNPKTALNTLGFVLAWVNTTTFVIELIYMQRLVNNQKFIKGKELTPIEKNLREVFYDDINEKAIRTSWFARNYNFLYLLRFGAFSIVLVNLQFLQIFQIFFSFVIVFFFSAACCYYQYFVEIYDSKNTTIIRITQECSLSLMIIMSNVFCLDTFLHFLNIKLKHFMVVLFAILMILNVALEVLLIVVDIYKLMKKWFCKKKRKTLPEFKKPTSTGEFNHLDNKIRVPKRAELEDEEEEEKVEDLDQDSIEVFHLSKKGKTKKGKTKEAIDIRKKSKTRPLRFADMGRRRVPRGGKKSWIGKNKLLK